MYYDRCNKPVHVPIRSDVVKDLLEGLLQINPDERLGSSRGIIEVKEHPFFKDINWETLQAREPQPFLRRPPLEVDLLTSNFDE